LSTPIFLKRLEILLGQDVITLLGVTRVAVFGVGGVGSWCVEALARNGVGDLTLIDADVVCETNINRQLQATHATVGASKVELLSRRIREINPGAKVDAKQVVYNRSIRDELELGSFDYVVDAIDSLGNKVDLMESALIADTVLFSSLGASRKLDPARVKTGSFWEVTGCPLGKQLRKRLRNRGIQKEFKCVYSDENLRPYAKEETLINGSSVQVTAVFGMFLASLVVNNVKAIT